MGIDGPPSLVALRRVAGAASIKSLSERETFMFKNPISLAVTIMGTTAFAWMAACSSSNSTSPGNTNTNGSSGTSSQGTGGSGTTGGTGGTGGSGSSSSGTGGSGTSSSGTGGGTGSADAGNPLQIDDQSAPVGSQIELKALTVPSGDSVGTWYTYGWNAAAGATLTPVQGGAFTFTSFDAGQFARAACVSSTGYVGYSAGEGFNFATAPSDSGNASAVPLDISAYTAITFWAMSSTSGGSMVRVKLPDDQTYGADSTAKCYQADSGVEFAGKCDDDFSYTASVTSAWTQFTVGLSANSAVDPLMQNAFGAQYADIDSHNVFGIQFENEGSGLMDGGASAFQFCIAQIDFVK